MLLVKRQTEIVKRTVFRDEIIYTIEIRSTRYTCVVNCKPQPRLGLVSVSNAGTPVTLPAVREEIAALVLPDAEKNLLTWNDTKCRWEGWDMNTLYAITDNRTGKLLVRPGFDMRSIGPEVTIRVATRTEAEERWQKPLHAGWTVSEPRRYHVIAINDKARFKVYMNATPMEHGPACTFLSKMVPQRQPHLRHMLEEVGSPHEYEVKK